MTTQERIDLMFEEERAGCIQLGQFLLDRTAAASSRQQIGESEVTPLNLAMLGFIQFFKDDVRVRPR